MEELNENEVKVSFSFESAPSHRLDHMGIASIVYKSVEDVVPQNTPYDTLQHRARDFVESICNEENIPVPCRIKMTRTEVDWFDI